MRCVSLHQPWASAMAYGEKSLETRGKIIHVRGPLAIHASKTQEWDSWDRELRRQTHLTCSVPEFYDLPFGAIIAVCELVGCIPTERLTLNGLVYSGDDLNGKYPVTMDDRERALGNYEPGRYAWVMHNMRQLREPIPYRGQQGIFFIPDDLITEAMLLPHRP